MRAAQAHQRIQDAGRAGVTQVIAKQSGLRARAQIKDEIADSNADCGLGRFGLKNTIRQILNGKIAGREIGGFNPTGHVGLRVRLFSLSLLLRLSVPRAQG